MSIEIEKDIGDSNIYKDVSKAKIVIEMNRIYNRKMRKPGRSMAC